MGCQDIKGGIRTEFVTKNYQTPMNNFFNVSYLGSYLKGLDLYVKQCVFWSCFDTYMYFGQNILL